MKYIAQEVWSHGHTAHEYLNHTLCAIYPIIIALGTVLNYYVVIIMSCIICR